MNPDSEEFDLESEDEDEGHEAGQPEPGRKPSAARLLTAEQEEQLKSLWENRKELQPDGQVRLYTLAAAVLERAARGGKLKSLLAELAKTNPDELDDYIGEFLLHKIFESPGQDPLHHAGALGLYFYHFLIGIDRKNRPLRDSAKPNADGDAATEAQGISLAELLAKDTEDADPAERFQANILHDADDLARLEGLAVEFLMGLPRWARLYLRFHDAADEGDGKLPRKKLADTYGIPSYQQKAWELGVVIPPHAPQRAGRVDLDWYAKNTLLGRWLRDAVKLDLDNPKQVLAGFKILCEVALKQVDDTGELL